MIGWGAGGLNYVDILSANVLFNLGERLSVRKRLEGDFTRLDSDRITDGLGQGLV